MVLFYLGRLLDLMILWLMMVLFGVMCIFMLVVGLFKGLLL